MKEGGSVMKWLFGVVIAVFLLPSVALAQLSEEDIQAITDSITVRALQMQAAEEDDEIHRGMDLKLDAILLNQAGFQALVKAFITQEMRRNAIRDVLDERRGQSCAVRFVSAAPQCNPCGKSGGRGMFRMFARGRF